MEFCKVLNGFYPDFMVEAFLSYDTSVLSPDILGSKKWHIH